MYPAIDLDNRRLCTTTETGDLVKFEFVILRDLARFNPDGCLDLVGQEFPALNVTRRSQTNTNLMIAWFFKSELCVERSDPIHMCFGDTQVIGDLIHGRSGNISCLTLAILQDRDQLLRLSRKPPEVGDILFKIWKGWLRHERSIG